MAFRLDRGYQSGPRGRYQDAIPGIWKRYQIKKGAKNKNVFAPLNLKLP
ncbi:MAG: hypothetical protein WD795_00625 [Woeseia sp.]